MAFSGGLQCGVIHAGGVLADGVIASQTAAGVRTVFAPKVTCRLKLVSSAAQPAVGNWRTAAVILVQGERLSRTTLTGQFDDVLTAYASLTALLCAPYIMFRTHWTVA